MNKKAILVVSFGTSYADSREKTIGAIEKTIAEEFPEWQVRRAFTSGFIIKKLKARDNLIIDNVEEALERAAEEGIETLVVQPTHVMSGFEYKDLCAEAEKYRDRFASLKFGEPLLTEEEDYRAVTEAVTDRLREYDDGKTALILMGHGTEAESNSVYRKLQKTMKEMGHDNSFIGTVEASPSLDDVRENLSPEKYERVVLEPLMVVAGDHANHDMAGEQPDSWKSVLEGDGYQVKCILEGLGQNPAIRKIYTEHVRRAIEG